MRLILFPSNSTNADYIDCISVHCDCVYVFMCPGLWLCAIISLQSNIFVIVAWTCVFVCMCVCVNTIITEYYQFMELFECCLFGLLNYGNQRKWNSFIRPCVGYYYTSRDVCRLFRRVISLIFTLGEGSILAPCIIGNHIHLYFGSVLQALLISFSTTSHHRLSWSHLSSFIFKIYGQYQSYIPHTLQNRTGILDEFQGISIKCTPSFASFISCNQTKLKLFIFYISIHPNYILCWLCVENFFYETENQVCIAFICFT